MVSNAFHIREFTLDRQQTAARPCPVTVNKREKEWGRTVSILFTLTRLSPDVQVTHQAIPSRITEPQRVFLVMGENNL